MNDEDTFDLDLDKLEDEQNENEDYFDESINEILKDLLQGTLKVSGEPIPEGDIGYISTLSFGVTAEGDMDVLIDWTNREANTAIHCGKLLHMLTTGQLNPQIIHALAHDKPKEDVDNIMFANQIMAMWHFLTKNQDTEPVVQPIQALKVTKPPGQGV